MSDKPEKVASPEPFVLTGEPAPERLPVPLALERLTETPDAPSDAWTVSEKVPPTATLAGGWVPNDSDLQVFVICVVCDVKSLPALWSVYVAPLRLLPV